MRFEGDLGPLEAFLEGVKRQIIQGMLARSTVVGEDPRGRIQRAGPIATIAPRRVDVPT